MRALEWIQGYTRAPHQAQSPHPYPARPMLHPQIDSEQIVVEKAEAEAALEEAIPALEEAASALNDLRKEDITEIRSFAKPHVLVQKVRGQGVRVQKVRRQG